MPNYKPARAYTLSTVLSTPHAPCAYRAISSPMPACPEMALHVLVLAWPCYSESNACPAPPNDCRLLSVGSTSGSAKRCATRTCRGYRGGMLSSVAEHTHARPRHLRPRTDRRAPELVTMVSSCEPASACERVSVSECCAPNVYDFGNHTLLLPPRGAVVRARTRHPEVPGSIPAVRKLCEAYGSV